MDNFTPTNPHDPVSFIILNPSQYFYYQTHHLAVKAPDGRHLCFIGKALQHDAEHHQFRFHEQMSLVTCLLGNINDTINLSMPAVSGLTDLLWRAQEACRGNFK